MLTDAQISAYRVSLLVELDALDKGDASGASERGPVTLDQQSVGRLSRMDALQRQAMAEASHRRREARRLRIRAALKCMDEGEFGFCQGCGEDIPKERLDLDPTMATCISCARG